MGIMSMKNDRKNEERLLKTAIQNEYLFYKRVIEDEFCLLFFLQQIAESYSPLKIDLISKLASQMLNPDTADLVKRFKERHGSLKDGYKQLLLLKPKRFSIFLKMIQAILTGYDFGEEWRDTFTTLTLTGVFCPPVLNFYVGKTMLAISPKDISLKKIKSRRPRLDPLIAKKIRERTGGKRIMRSKPQLTLLLNSTTSMEDIENSRAELKMRQTELWPDFQKTNLTKKSLKNLSIYMRDLGDRFRNKTARDLSTWKTSRRTDMDRVGDFWSDEKDASVRADKKRRSNLRQIRHRHSKK
jgi:hypothetical protein